jgi:hypothetical protein
VLADAGYWSNAHIDALRERASSRSSPRTQAATNLERRGSAAPGRWVCATASRGSRSAGCCRVVRPVVRARSVNGPMLSAGSGTDKYS